MEIKRAMSTFSKTFAEQFHLFMTLTAFHKFP